MKTLTIFRAYSDGSIIALFPELNYENGEASERGLCMSYVHVGQHGEADYAGVIANTEPADDWQIEDLAEELRSIGYDLDIRKKKPVNVNV